MFENDYLMHYGIKGQKWGVRRYQNTDGSWTAAGKARYSKSSGKRAKYGSEGMSSEVYNLNKKIDNYNRRLQNTRVMNDSIHGLSTKKMAALQGTKGVAVNAAQAGSSLASLPVGAAAGILGSAGLLNAAMGAGVTAGMKRGASKRTNEKRLEKKIKKLQEKRNALDPRQANRQGSLLSKEEYAKSYNMGKGSMYGFGAGGLLGGIAGSVIGSRSKNTRDAEYENYKKSAVAYGSKKNGKRAKYGDKVSYPYEPDARVEELFNRDWSYKLKDKDVSSKLAKAAQARVKELYDMKDKYGYDDIKPSWWGYDDKYSKAAPADPDIAKEYSKYSGKKKRR